MASPASTSLRVKHVELLTSTPEDIARYFVLMHQVFITEKWRRLVTPVPGAASSSKSILDDDDGLTTCNSVKAGMPARDARAGRHARIRHAQGHAGWNG